MLSRDLGGIQQSFVDYSRALELADFKVINVVSKGAKITENNSAKYNYFLTNLMQYDPFSVIGLSNIIKKEKPDIIIAHGNRAINFARWSRAKSLPIIGVAHNYKIKHLLKCDYCFSITNHLKSHLIAANFAAAHIFHVPNMIELVEKTRDAASSEVPVIGSMGRFVKKKGFDVLLKSLAELKSRNIKFKAIIGGEGEEKNNLLDLRSSLHLEKEVDFSGWVSDKDDFFNKIDIFCLPSLHEPFGIILLEAMVRKVPVISSDSEGPSEIIENHSSGVFCKMNNAVDMSDKLADLIVDKGKQQEITRNASLRLKENYDIRVQSINLKKIIKRIMDGNK